MITENISVIILAISVITDIIVDIIIIITEMLKTKFNNFYNYKNKVL